MRASLRLLLLTISLTLTFFACQKELSFEVGAPARGSLQDDNGDCLPKFVGGTYRAGTVLGDTNYIDVTVDVAQPGTYIVVTDTLNGYWFRGTGSFTNTGASTVRLRGFGTPTNAGDDDFLVRFDTSVCYVEVTVVPGTGGGGTAAVFTLQGAGGACGSFTPAGTYTQGTALTSANTVSFQVNVTTPGTWTLSSNTVAGISFSGTGTFTSTGLQTVTLTGSGTPAASGAQNFSITSGAASCSFPITVNANTNPQAAYALVGAGGACGTPVVAGTYTQGTATGGGNTVTLNVNVTTAGQWTASTNTVAGVSFNGTGTFTGTGAQTIILTAAGTPLAAGTQTFTVTAGSSTCTFTVAFVAQPVATGDLFPLTANSYWTYNDQIFGSGSDTAKIVNFASATGNGNTYRVFELIDNEADSVLTQYYRKSGNDYFEYNFGDFYSSLSFDASAPATAFGDILFLKENMTANQTWNSAEFSHTIGGVPTKIRYVFTCNSVNGTLTVNGRTFNGVAKITFKPQKSTNNGPWTDDTYLWEVHYAPGVGMIQRKVTVGANSGTQSIRFYQVF